MTFTPTHEIHIKYKGKLETECILVRHFSDKESTKGGVLCTEDEYKSCSVSDWTMEDDGTVLFQGEVPVCDEYWIEKVTEV